MGRHCGTYLSFNEDLSVNYIVRSLVSRLIADGVGIVVSGTTESRHATVGEKCRLIEEIRAEVGRQPCCGRQAGTTLRKASNSQAI